MEILNYMLSALQDICTPIGALYVIGGTIAGIVLGAIPGLGASTMMLILIPIAYKMDIVMAMSLFISLEIGGISGGYIGSILLGIPGTAASVCTTWDGYEMTKQGNPVRPLSVAATCNFLGTVPSIVLAIACCRFIAAWAIKLGPWEYSALCFAAIATVVGLSKGNMARSMVGVGMALVIAAVGSDPMNGVRRLTFGSKYLMSGVDIVTLMLGMFAAKIILFEFARQEKSELSSKIKVEGYRFPGKDLLDNLGNVIRSWFTGAVIGFLPGLGGPIASVLCYSNEKNLSKDPTFGRGHIGGVIASETGNNSAIGGALIPMIALGIPGDAAMVQFMAAMNSHSIYPGPLLMKTNPDIVYMIFTAGILAGIVTLLYETLGMKSFPAILKIPYHYLYALVIVLSFSGSAMAYGTMYGVLLTLFGCALGIFMDYFRIPDMPFLMAFILAPMLEKNVRQGFNYSTTGGKEFVTHPLSLIFILIGIVLLIYPVLAPVLKRRKKQ